MTNETMLPIVGNLTADPELRYSQNGIAYATLTIAKTPRHFDKQSNEWKDGESMFIRCTVWREFAEHVAGSLTKGMRVIAYGALQNRVYETKEGERRSSLELNIDAIGPDLRYSTATVTRAARQGAAWNDQAPASVAADQDAWATQQAGGGYGDDTPF